MFFETLIVVGYFLWNIWAIEGTFRSKETLKARLEASFKTDKFNRDRIFIVPLFVVIMLLTLLMYGFISQVFSSKFLLVYLVFVAYYRGLTFVRHNKAMENRDADLISKGRWIRRIIRIINFIIAIALVGHVLF